MASNLAKRAFDVVFACLGLIISAPVLVLCAIAIKLDSAGPILFRQTRVGRYGRRFEILKLRSMNNSPDKHGPKLTVSGDPRITRVGRWLRAAKLDELPQLYNVLHGEMSLVGPRPEVPEYVASYNSRQKQLLNFKPGITGPASLDCIREEALLSAEEDPEMFYRQHLLPRKLELDLHYCESANVASDLQLLATTILHLVFPINRSGATS
jgi:lipopolysaccharide/colanic/teichoic acid biosynthesis glycosyltransferase